MSEPLWKKLFDRSYMKRVFLGPHPYVTPFNLSPVILVIVYFTVEVLTGYAIANVTAMKSLLISRNVLTHITDPNDLDAELSSILNLGFSMSILFTLIAGIAMDYAGPKIAGVISLLMFCGAWIVLFFGPSQSELALRIGSAILGASFSGIYICHTSVSTMFPQHKIFVLGVIGSGPDLSLFTTHLLSIFAKTVNVQLVVGVYVVISFLFAVLEFFILPWKVFDGALKDEANGVELTSVSKATVSNDFESQKNEDVADSVVASGAGLGSFAVPTDTNAAERNRSCDKNCLFGDLSILNQLKTPEYWLYMTIFVTVYFRKSNFGFEVINVFNAIAKQQFGDEDAAEWYINLFSAIQFLSFVSALAMGWITNRFGVIKSIFLVNLFAVLLYLFASIPVLQLQVITTFMYILLAGYIVGNMFAFIAQYYGYRNLGTLQGIMNLASFFMQLLWEVWKTHVVKNLSNVLITNYIFLALGVAVFALIFILWWLLNRREPKCSLAAV